MTGLPSCSSPPARKLIELELALKPVARRRASFGVAYRSRALLKVLVGFGASEAALGRLGFADVGNLRRAGGGTAALTLGGVYRLSRTDRERRMKKASLIVASARYGRESLAQCPLRHLPAIARPVAHQRTLIVRRRKVAPWPNVPCARRVVAGVTLPSADRTENAARLQRLIFFASTSSA